MDFDKKSLQLIEFVINFNKKLNDYVSKMESSEWQLLQELDQLLR